MIFIGATNISTPNTPGFYVYPPNGRITVKLDASSQSPVGGMLYVGTPYIISELGGSTNQAFVIDSTGDTIPIQIVFVDNTLPSTLEMGKCYVSRKEGFRSSFYLSSLYLGYQFQYRIGTSASVITTTMLDAMFPVGEIKGLISKITNNPYLIPCDGTVPTVKVQEYPEYNNLVLSIPGLLQKLGGDGVNTVGIPNLSRSFPVFITSVSDLAQWIPNSNTTPGTVFEKSTMAKVSFNHPHNHGYDRSNDRNGKKNDAAGVSGPQPNEGLSGSTTSSASAGPDFGQPVIADTGKVQLSDSVIAPPHAPLYPHILIR